MVTVKELKTLAKSLGIKGYSKMKKEELLVITRSLNPIAKPRKKLLKPKPPTRVGSKALHSDRMKYKERMKSLISKNVSLTVENKKELKDLIRKGGRMSLYELNDATFNSDTPLDKFNFLIHNNGIMTQKEQKSLTGYADRGMDQFYSRLIEQHPKEALDVMKDLEKRGHDIYDGENLGLAVYFKITPLVKYLSKKTKDMKTIFHDIGYWLTLPHLKILVEAGADIKYKNHKVLRDVVGDLPSVKYLVAKGADVNAGQGGNQSHDERVTRSVSPLSGAVQAGNLETVKFLVSKGAKVGAHDNHAIKTAKRLGHVNIHKFLLKV